MSNQQGQPKIIDTNLLQECFIDIIVDKKLPTAVYLSNGIKLQGKILAHDSNTLLLEGNNNGVQLIYKRAVSTVVPAGLSVADIEKALSA